MEDMTDTLRLLFMGLPYNNNVFRVRLFLISSNTHFYRIGVGIYCIVAVIDGKF